MNLNLIYRHETLQSISLVSGWTFYFRICFTFNNAEFMRELKFRLFYPGYGQSEKPTMLYSQNYRTHGELLTIGECDLLVLGPGSLKIMQYTGLKDKNGKEIYEGDLLRYPGDSKNFTAYEVFFHDGDAHSNYDIGYCIARTHNHGNIAGCLIPSFKPKTTAQMEIIGNIYETPNLLK